MLTSGPPIPQNMTVFEDRAFKEVIKLKWDHWALIQYDWYPYKKKSLRHRSVQGEMMWRHGEKTAIYKSRREASGETNSVDSLSLDIQPPELWEVNICCLELLGSKVCTFLCCFCLNNCPPGMCEFMFPPVISISAYLPQAGGDHFFVIFVIPGD